MKQQTPSDGPQLADSLRPCLIPAVVLVDAQGTATLTPEASQMLKLAVSPSAAGPSGALPAALLAMTEEVMRSETGTCFRKLDLSAGDGLPMSLHASAVRLGRGEKTDTVLVLNDLTGARNIERLLLQLDRLANIGTISASMAHEVRNALVACRTFVDLLLEKHPDSELASIVRREMKRIDDLVSRMLKHSSTAAGTRRALHVHEVLENALRLLEPQFAERHIRLECSLRAAPDLLEGDENQLQQAFMNLLLNSLEAMTDNGLLTIETTSEPAGVATPDGISITIRDTGTGVLPENLGRLFEPFFTTKPDGTGLGLAVTQRIVKEHRGTITVQSRVGQGTSFRLVLPV